MSASNSTGGGGGGDPWAWLGLLKWTLAQQKSTNADAGTTTSSNDDAPPPPRPATMSKEDIEFLEKVMKEGIIDENERMKTILQEFSNIMEYYHKNGGNNEPSTSIDDIEELLQELRDIVEHIDYARAFVQIQGIQYMLGAITTPGIPESIVNMCLLVLATLAQNNPPVQKDLIERGALKTLSDLFFQETTQVSTKTKIMQAISAIVRNYDTGETVFERLPQAPLLMVQGLNPNPVISNESLRNKTLFFLQAFLLSDTTSNERINKFKDSLILVADPQYLDDGNNSQIRETSIHLLNQLLERNLAIDLILERKDMLASLGVQRISYLRSLTGEEADFTQTELQQWESFLIHLARANPANEQKLQSA